MVQHEFKMGDYVMETLVEMRAAGKDWRKVLSGATVCLVVALVALMFVLSACGSNPTGQSVSASAASGCKALASWEQTGTGNIVDDKSAQTRIENAAAGTQFATDFRTWATASDATRASHAAAVSNDCHGYGYSDVFSGIKAAAPAADPTPSPTAAALKASRVWFVVKGDGEPDITYGSDSDNRDGGGTLGELGDGNALPWKSWVPFDSSAMYYSLNAQLEGGGDITCQIIVTGPGLNPTVVASGHASGGYNICDAQATSNDTSGLNWSQEG